MGDMGDANGQYLHGQSFMYDPLHMVTDGGGGGEKYEKFTLSTKKINMFHYQTHGSSVQGGQTNQRVGVWSPEGFTAGPCKQTDGSYSPRLWALWNILTKHF